MDPNAGPVAGMIGDSTVPIGSLTPDTGRYVLAQPVAHHASCPGNYIIGQVLGVDGGPRAGVHVTLVDQWGNQADAISKSGATDLGNYDFPINDFANRYTLTVVDSIADPISPPVSVDHLQGSGGDASCHTVIWQEVQ
jgi:hypothetical protein